MSDHVTRRLRWFLLLGMALFVAGTVLACVAMLRVSAWTLEFGGKPEDYPLSDVESDSWLAFFDAVSQLWKWAIPLIALGAGAIAGSIASLAWATKGRFSLRMLLVGVTFVCFVFGIPFGVVRPLLQNPRFVYLGHGIANFEQRGKPASLFSYVVLNRRIALTATIPLIVPPVRIFWP